MTTITKTMARDTGNGVRDTEVKHFTQLKAWQAAFGLVSQMRRAAISIKSNIAEGFGRISPDDKKHFYVTAKSSAYELESQIYICHRLEFFTDEQKNTTLDLCRNTQKLLSGLILSMKNRSK